MKYRIKPGYSFRDSDNSVKTGGDVIELDAESLAIHGDKVDPVDPAPLATQELVPAAPDAEPYDHAQ